MKKKSQPNESMILHRALRIAAIEAYHSEVLDTDRFTELIGSDKEFPTIDSWIRDRINTWIQEADLKTKK